MNKILFCPFGGVGEIGANSMLVKTTKCSVLIDSGLLFPDSDHFGIDFLHPNFEKLKLYGCDALILTHAHEDHLGATKELLKIFPDLTIYGPPLVFHVLRKKFPFTKFNFKSFSQENELLIGDLKFTPIHVNHSIPQTTGIHILWEQEGNLQSFFYVSDFKVDLSNEDEKPFEIDLLNKLSQKAKTKWLFADSTNILKKGKTPSESDVLKGLEQALSKSEGRSFISLFSSNIQRLFGLMNIAQKQSRNVYLLGRSAVEFYHIGLQIGLKTSAKVFFETEGTADQTAIYIISGCQGDFRGALRRFAANEIKGLHPGKGDQFIYSAKAIPGNEEKVTRILNQIVEFGCDVITVADYLVHASGHPFQDDLRWLYENYMPTHATPIHGESYFLFKHDNFIKNQFPSVTPVKIFNGQAIEIQPNGQYDVLNEMDFDYCFIHDGGTPIEKSALSQRRKLASQGVAVAVYKGGDKKILCFLDWIGLPEWLEKDKNSLILETEEYLISSTFNRSKNKTEEARIFIKSLFKKKLGYSPVVMVKEVK